MTRTLLCALAALWLSPFFLFSQNQNLRLFGISSRGGANNSGSVFSLSTDGSAYTLEHSFDKAGPLSPLGTVVRGSDGKLYGTASGGGEQNYGIIFRSEADGTGFSALHHFDNADGASPYSTLIEASDGKLYGSTVFGGPQNAGVIFCIEKNGEGFAVLHHFSGPDGSRCYSGVAEGSDGMLYGTTQIGGGFDEGTVFRIAKDGTGFAVMHAFLLSAEGGIPYGQLIEDQNGYLYGTFAEGGSGNGGGVFRIRTDGTGFQVLKNFSFSVFEGASPLGTLTEAPNGRLYGTTASGGTEFKGTIFSLNKDGSNFTNEHSFVGLDGSLALPGNRLFAASDGKLYGVNFSGGTANAGTVYRFGPSTTGFAKIFDFDVVNGDGPYVGVIELPNGQLCGTTSHGGEGGLGTVFQLDKNGSNFSTIHTFDIVNADGVGPVAKLIVATDGWLYGTAEGGGHEGIGTIFRTDPSSGSLEVVHSFEQSTGTGPAGKLLQASNGMLYGTAAEAGLFDRGTIFRMGLGADNFEAIYHFTDLTFDGARPQAGLIQASDGMLYGTTASGGAFGAGSVFRIGMDGTAFAQLFSFNFQETGNSPSESIIEGSDGKLYGVTAFGGAATASEPNGTAFRLNKDGSGFTVLHTFDREANGFPAGPLIEGPGGFLFGNTTNGAAFESGSTYRIAKDGSGFQMIHEFDVAGGTSPQGELLLNPADNSLYGVTRLGGSMDSGVVFRISPDGNDFEKIYDFQGYPNGSSVPDGGLTLVELPTATKLPIQLKGVTLAPNPASSQVQFFWENDFPSHAPAQVRITNGQGQLVFQQQANLQLVNSLLRAHSITWPSGTYFVEVMMEAGVFSEKVVKI